VCECVSVCVSVTVAGRRGDARTSEREAEEGILGKGKKYDTSGRESLRLPVKAAEWSPRGYASAR
jgi:hypothetical protein